MNPLWPKIRHWVPNLGLLLILTLALTFRLLVYSWHQPYPLSGDEIGFFEQARTFVQGRGYHDVELMRGPLYPLFLAVVFRFCGAEVSAARLAQTFLSTATVPLLYLWASRRHTPRAGLLAAALGAFLFPLVVQTTFLLTETLFVFLFVLGMVLLEGKVNRPRWWLLLLLGMTFGLAALTRSIGLPLVAVGMVGAALPFPGVLIGGRDKPPSPVQPAPGSDTASPEIAKTSPGRFRCTAALLVLAGAAAVILPWTVRNALTYRAFILVDTSGATNLWLDNDGDLLLFRLGPDHSAELDSGEVSDRLRRQFQGSGNALTSQALVEVNRAGSDWTIVDADVKYVIRREGQAFNVYRKLDRDAIKRELLKYPEGQRQALSLQQGFRAIIGDPAWFADKGWQEMKKFFALEYFDDFLARPAIWYPPGEVWSRVFLGDGLYLLLVAAGLVGLFGSRTRLKVLDVLWLAYVPLTALLFHVELRYRLPFLVALIPYAALTLAHPRRTWAALRRPAWRAAGAGLALLALGGLLLAHADYPALSVQIVGKRIHVALGQGALRRGDGRGAEEQARAALAVYGESAEARVLLAQALRAQGRLGEAEAVLREAIAYRSGHPHPHLLLGDLLRSQGRWEEAACELAYERNSLEDLQRWAWDNLATPVPGRLDLGSGLELGYILGWHLTESPADGPTFRWSDERVTFRLAVPAGPATWPRSGPASLRLTLRLAAGRPEGLPLPQVEVWWDGNRLGVFTVENGWHVYTLEVAAMPPGGILEFELRSSTFRPHEYDRHLDDNRALGVMVDWVAVADD